MSPTQSWENELAPAVQVLLEAFHEDTPAKVQLAPDDSPPMLQRTDGSICELDEDGWPDECGFNDSG